jgi:hypothetical protein
MWLTAPYESVSLFSLKASTATSSGDKTLLTPTPFALKMALLDTAFRTGGAAWAKNQWRSLRALQVALRPAPRAVVTNLFQRIMKPTRADSDNKSKSAFTRTIGYREYVQLQGEFAIGVSTDEEEFAPVLERLLTQLHYIGKRGSFVQLVGAVTHASTLSDGFVLLTQAQDQFPIQGVMQVLDDCAPTVSFEKVDIYSGASIKLGKDRILRNIVLPYRIARSSRSFTLYERVE